MSGVEAPSAGVMSRTLAMTTRWSPAVNCCSTRQSNQAREPCRCGVPHADSDHTTVLSLSSPLADSARQTCCWSSARRLTLKVLASEILGQLVEECITLNV